MGSGGRCKFRQWGLGQSCGRKTILDIFGTQKNVFDGNDFGSFDYRDAIATAFTEAHCQMFTEVTASVPHTALSKSQAALKF